jgi:hypothetical protein
MAKIMTMTMTMTMTTTTTKTTTREVPFLEGKDQVAGGRREFRQLVWLVRSQNARLVQIIQL